MNQNTLSKTSAEKTERAEILKEFQTLPGVGESISEDLYILGYRSIEEFKTAEPIMMYERLCIKAGKHLDRCLLYTFRCIVYSVNTLKPERKKLNWWYWKDKQE